MPIAPAADDPVAAFAAALEKHPDCLQGRVGLAVSGGGDSIAMMQLLHRLRPDADVRVATVNHHLRPEAEEETAFVALEAGRLGYPHRVLDWSWDRQGNLQAAARAGRRQLLFDWAGSQDVATLWLGQTHDDQVETFLMRLARGSGVDGLAGMDSVSQHDNLRIFRPLLAIPRSALRRWLEQQKLDWRDDPSNDDTRFDRIKARQLLTGLSDLGLTPDRVVQTVDHMQAARHSLREQAQEFANAHVRYAQGSLWCDPVVLNLSTGDTHRRVLADMVSWLGGQVYRPRFDGLQAMAAKVQAGDKATLAGTVIKLAANGQVLMTREPARMPIAHGMTPLVWDARWAIDGPSDQHVTVKALGADVFTLPGWRDWGIDKDVLAASPAIWLGDRLISAPLVHFGPDWGAQIVANFHSQAFGIEDRG